MCEVLITSRAFHFAKQFRFALEPTLYPHYLHLSPDAIMAKGKKKKGGKAAAAADPGSAGGPETFLSNYKMACKALGIEEVSEQITSTFEKESPPEELCLADDLGPGGVHALTMALLGSGAGMQGPYKALKSIRLWQCNIGPVGAGHVADFLRQAGDDQELCFLEFMNNKLGEAGCAKLGTMFSEGSGGRERLTHLFISLDRTVGNLGIKSLSQGLRSSKLEVLRLEQLALTSECVPHLLRALKGNTTIKELSLSGNNLMEDGLLALVTGDNSALKRVPQLDSVDVSSNMVGPDKKVATALKDYLLDNKFLKTFLFHDNPIDVECANILLDVVTPKEKVLEEFSVFAGLPAELYEKLCLSKGGGKKKKGKKKKGKKKKK